MSKRLVGHRAASSLKTTLPIYKHFSSHSHNFESDIHITILEKTSTSLLLNRETYWISTLETVYPKGLNSHYE